MTEAASFSLVDPKIDIHDLNEIISTDLPTEGFDTLGGYLYDGLNAEVRIVGDEIPDAILVHEVAIGIMPVPAYHLVFASGRVTSQDRGVALIGCW